MFKKPNPRQDFSDLDTQVTLWWKENKIFEKSVTNRKDSEEYIFYDGPPFMSGTPHYGSILSSVAKDIVPRYKTMKGNKVERLWGWDCHGLPIENKVEKQMGIKDKNEIEKDLETFIQKCYEWNRVGIDNWKWYIDKIGRWADIDNAYRTLDQDYMESIWWVFSTMWKNGYIYKGVRTSLFSTDSSTPVSNFEVSMDPDNYQDTEDIAVYVKFKILDDNSLESKTGNKKPFFAVAWTTTPWTLMSNFALAVNPELEYSIVEYGDENLVLAKNLVEKVFSGMDYTVVASVKGSDLANLAYEQLFDDLSGGENDFKIYSSDYVDSAEGSGILHVAPAFGEADFNMGKEWNLTLEGNIDEQGILTSGNWKGVYLRDANPQIADYLTEKCKLLKKEKYVHRLPYYRYKNPLIYKTQESYFVNVEKLRKKFIQSNEDINWVPDHFKEGRFKHVLETAPEWSISRSRYWGTPMPIWESEDGSQIIVGSRDELMELVNNSADTNKIQKVILSLDEKVNESFESLESKVKDFLHADETVLEIKSNQSNLSRIRNLFLGETEADSVVKLLSENESRAYYLHNGLFMDLHRPYIDNIEFIVGDKKFKRIKETLDVWMDSGSMPFAQFHYPFVNKDLFERNFPGDFISEYTGQIRAWFYVLHLIANAVFEKPAFKNVLVTGVIAGTDGRKMSKSYNNYPDPRETLEKYGGEALRLYFAGSTVLDGNDMNFNENDLKMQVREFLLPLWNIYSYLVTYANIHEWNPSEDLAYNFRNVTQDSHPWDHIPFDDIENNMDAWILHKLQSVIKEVTISMDSYQIPRSVRAIKSLIDDTSKWYIRRSRDRFANGEARALEVLYYVLVETIKLLAPFAPFITEHIYKEIVSEKVTNTPESIHLCDYPEADERFLEEYAKLPNEMELIRKITELGHSIRTTNNIKLRQPLSKLYVVNTNLDLGELSQWMRELLEDELNIQEVTEVVSIPKSKSIITAEHTDLNIKVGLEIEISTELAELGNLREFTRNIQAIRKKTGLEFGDKINLVIDENEANIAKLVINFENEIKESINAIEITTEDLSSDLEAVDLNINEVTTKVKINKV